MIAMLKPGECTKETSGAFSTFGKCDCDIGGSEGIERYIKIYQEPLKVVSMTD